MKIRIAALVVLGIALIATTVGAIAVGAKEAGVVPGPIPSTEELPDTAPPINTQPQTQPMATQPATDEYQPRENHIHFLAAGDNLVYSYIRRNANILAGGSGDSTQYSLYGFNYAPMYEQLRPLVKNTDLAFYNQEGPVVDDRASGGMTATLGDQMLEMGFNVVNIANNDMLSSGEQGLMDSISYWKEKSGVALLGANVTPETKNQVTVIEKNHIKIAFLSYTYGVSEGNEPGEDSGITLPLIDKDQMTADVKLARDEGVDLIFVYLHWGEVGRFDRSGDQSEIAQHLVDLNVDVIIGSHPNVIQEMKWKQRSDGGRTLICYSLGNLISAMPYNDNLLGGLLSLDIDKDEQSGKCAISNVEFIPTFTHYDENYKQISVYLLKDYNQEMLDTHGSSILKGRGYYDNFIRTLQRYIPREFLDDYYNSYVFESSANQTPAS